MASESACPPGNSVLGTRNIETQPGASSSLLAAPQVITGGSFVTKEDLDACLKEIQAKSIKGVMDLKLSYHQRIAAKPYPKDYVSPKFMMFNGKKGSAKEHLLKFIETIGVYGLDDDLKLKEFSKSLTEKAYTWYVNLLLGLVDSWGT